MAYQLKTTGLAVDLLCALRVDEDGLTLKEFVNGWTSTWNGSNAWTDNNSAFMTVHDAVVVGQSSWKGTQRDYFETADSGFTLHGVEFVDGDGIVVSGGDVGGGGFGAFIPSAGITEQQGGKIIAETAGDRGFYTVSDTTYYPIWTGANGATAVDIPLTTPFALGGNYEANTSNTSVVYALETEANLTEHGGLTAASTNINSVGQVGGRDGQDDNQPGRYHGIFVFSRKLTLAEYETLHDGWHGVLFEASDSTAPTVSSAETDVAGDTVTVTFNEALDTVNDTAGGEWAVNVNSSPVTINSAAIDTGSTTNVVIELAAAVAGGDTITADYSGTSLRDDAGNQVATFTGQSVTNNFPHLTNATGTATGETTADGSVDTNTGSGTLYWITSTSNTKPGTTQIKNGQDNTGSAAPASGNQVVSATGTQNVSATGLVNGTTYYFHYLQNVPE